MPRKLKPSVHAVEALLCIAPRCDSEGPLYRVVSERCVAYGPYCLEHTRAELRKMRVPRLADLPDKVRRYTKGAR